MSNMAPIFPTQRFSKVVGRDHASPKVLTQRGVCPQLSRAKFSSRLSPTNYL